MIAAQESELAFTLFDRDGVENHRLFRNRDTSCRRLLSTYFDTPTHLLGRAGWSVRQRQDGERWLQTVKGPTVLATRPELEIPCDGQALDTDHLRSTPVWPLINGNVQDLKPIFQTDIVRIARILHSSTATIEAAIDDGDIYNMDRSRRTPIKDLELEKKSGDIAVLFRVAVELTIDTRIMIESASKAQRGYQLIDGQGPPVYKNREIKLDREMSAIDGFRQIMTEIIAHMRKNLKPAYVGNPGGIHQLRVAIRRMRSALIMFKHVLRVDTVLAFDDELRHFGQILGEARDWDVFIAETLITAGHDLPKAKWIDLIDHLAKKQQSRVHAWIATVIESPRFNSLLVGLMGWVEDVPMRSRNAEHSMRKVVPYLLTGVNDKVERRERQLTDSTESVHALRKALKKLRYAIEFIDSLYPPKTVKIFLGPCKDLQEILGRVNDVATTHRLLALLIAENAALVPATEELSGWLGERERSAVAAFPKLLRRLRHDKPFWH